VQNRLPGLGNPPGHGNIGRDFGDIFSSLQIPQSG
jgi:hypothetical protein